MGLFGHSAITGCKDRACALKRRRAAWPQSGLRLGARNEWRSRLTALQRVVSCRIPHPAPSRTPRSTAGAVRTYAEHFVGSAASASTRRPRPMSTENTKSAAVRMWLPIITTRKFAVLLPSTSLVSACSARSLNRILCACSRYAINDATPRLPSRRTRRRKVRPALPSIAAGRPVVLRWERSRGAPAPASSRRQRPGALRSGSRFALALQRSHRPQRDRARRGSAARRAACRHPIPRQARRRLVHPRPTIPFRERPNLSEIVGRIKSAARSPQCRSHGTIGISRVRGTAIRKWAWPSSCSE